MSDFTALGNAAPSAAHEAAQLERFVEQVELRAGSVRVDRARGIIAGVKILGLESRNGRTYQPHSLARAVPLYEGARVNVDHPRGGTSAPRGYEERIGTVRRVRAERSGLYGDFHFNPKHRLAEQLLWDAEHAPENVGFSHNVTARTSRSAGRVIVEEITAVQSVDLVADPATTRGLFESTGAERWDNASQSWLPLEEQTGVPHAQQITERAEHESLQAALRLLEAENQRLRQELFQLQQGETELQRRQTVERRIAEANLPAALNTEVFREQCYAASDDAALHRLIEARRQDARLMGQTGKPRSIEQNRQSWLEPSPLDAASFAAALR